MKITSVDIIERAKNGERIGTAERRRAVAYIMGAMPELTNNEIAAIFEMSEGQIRADKKTIREEKAKLIKEDDIGLVIADIALNFDRQIKDLEKSKQKCATGTRTFLEHCKSIFTLELMKVKALQDLGYYPKNLGNLSIEKFEYKAIVSKDGGVDTRPVHLVIADTKAEQDIMDAEFEEVSRKAIASGDGIQN